MKKKNFSLFALLVSGILFAQNFEVPQNYSFKAPEDYSSQYSNIVKAVTWLENTPLNQETAKRKEVNTYLMSWLTGTPDVSIVVSSDIVTFMNCSDCLMIFMGSWASYAIKNKDYNNVLKGNMIGIESAIAFYEKNKGFIGKNKSLEKYKKLQEKGTLENDVKSKI